MEELVDFSYRTQGKNKLSNKEHSHSSCYEILFVHSGEGTVLIRNKLYPLKKNTIYFINGNETHCFAPRETECYIRNIMVIQSSYVEKLAEFGGCSSVLSDLFLDEGGSCIELNDDQAMYLNSEFLNIKSFYEADDVYTRIHITLSLFQILTFAHSHRHLRAPSIKNSIAQMLTYINHNIHRKMDLDELSSHLHCNKYYLCHMFKKETDLTIHEYITLQRLAAAKKMLLYSEEPLSVIALECGFGSFSYFSKVFKEQEQETPSGFRNKYKKNSTSKAENDML